MIEQKYKNDIKNMFINMSLICLIYIYMLANFWWGNHDWGFLKSGASVESGLFEARYSQHLFTLLFFEGHILPVFAFMSGFACIIAQAFAIGKYFRLPKNAWVLISLFIAVNPHIYALFYYVYLFFPFMVWSLVGVWLLFFTEGKLSLYKFICGVVGFVFLLGSYPPNLAFIFVIFVAKRIFEHLDERESLKENIKRVLFFGLQFLSAGLVYKIITFYMEKLHLINLDMYNIKTKGILEVIKSIPYEFVQSYLQLVSQFSFMGWGYVLPLLVVVISALVVLFRKAKNKVYLGVGIVILFFVSRFAFMLSIHPEYAVFRLMYWARLGIYVFALSVLLKEKEVWGRNILFLMLVLVVGACLRANFEIQKVQNLGFVAGRMYQKNLIEIVESNENFDKTPHYISLNFGQPNFRKKFYSGKHATGELIGLNLVFEFDVANYLFWEEEKSPVIIGAGISGRDILRVDRDGGERWRNVTYWSDNPVNMDNIKYWLYTKATPYPSPNSVYIDDKYLLLVLDRLTFYKHRELVARALDKR